MARHHPVAAQFQTSAQQMVEFQIAVALNAGIGGGAAFIAMDEIADDLLVEVVGEIKNIVTHTQPGSDLSCVLHIVQTAAGAANLRADVGIVIQAHGGSRALVSGFFHQISRHGAVHAAAHGDQGLLGIHIALLGQFMIGVYQWAN